jgi:hypothetical protein
VAHAYPVLQATGTGVEGQSGISVSWPTHQANDVGLLCVETLNTDSDVTVSGWTHVTGSPLVGGGTKLNVLWKRAASGSEAAVSVPDTGDHQYGVITTVRGLPAGFDPPYREVGTDSGTATSYPTIPGTNNDYSHTLHVTVIARSNDAAGAHFSGWGLSWVGTMTESFDNGTALGSGGGLGIAWINVFDTGSTFSDQANTSVSADFASITLAFNIEPESPWFVAQSSSASGAAVSFDVTYPAGIAAGDLALLVIEQSGNESAVTATGFSQISGSPQYDLNTTSGSLLSVMSRVLDGTETTTTVSASTDHALARMYVFRNAQIDVSGSQKKTTASGTGTAPAVTTTVDDTLVFVVVSRPNDATGSFYSNWTNANLSDLTGVYYETGTVSGNGGGFSCAMGYKATAGSTGTTTVSISTSVTDVAYTIALKAKGKGSGMFWANLC